MFGFAGVWPDPKTAVGSEDRRGFDPQPGPVRLDIETLMCFNFGLDGEA